MMLGVLLMQLVGCSGTSSNPVTSSSSANSHGSLSAVESEAQAVAINAWISLLNARQGIPNTHLYTTVTNMAPSAVSQALSKGNTVSVTWEACRPYAGTKGEAQIKNFTSVVGSESLSQAEQANGITWKGIVNFTFITRYRAVGWTTSTSYPSFSPDDISPPPDNEPFSPWSNSYVFTRPVKQNGEWYTTFNISQGEWYPPDPNYEIINPLTIAVGYGVLSYGYEPYLIKQTTPYQPVKTPTTSITSHSVTNMIASADNLRILGSFDNVAQAYDTSSSSYLKLYWTYGQQLVIPNSGTNLYAMGKYTQTKDGAGNYPGQCVSFVKALTNTSNLNTDSWIIGKRVMDGGVMPGTAIATFTKNNGKQFNSGIDHAAIFKGYLADGSGFDVWDQNWDFTGVVGTHAIKIIGSKGYPNTFANNYYVIQITLNTPIATSSPSPTITWQQPVATINNTTISMDYFVKMLRYFYILSNGNISSNTFPYQVLRQIENDELVRRGAPSLGIEVTLNEVTEKINNDLISWYGGGGSITGSITLPQTDLGKIYQQWLKRICLSDSEYRQVIEATLLTQKVKDLLTQNVPTEDKQVHLYAIKVDNEGNAAEVENRLHNGEDFATLAAEVSTDETSKQYGGDIGWLPQGILLPELDQAAFSLAIGSVSKPIVTTTGYYIIKVVEIDNNRLIDNYREILASNAFTNWFTEQRNATEIREYWDETTATWALNHVT
jgi:hypothetical protein